MAEKLRAIPDLLGQLSSELTNHAQSLLAIQMSCHGAAEDAQFGWVGLSATALAGLLDAWATASTAHTGRLGEHACGMHVAAAGFAEMEQSNAAALAKVNEIACKES